MIALSFLLQYNGFAAIQVGKNGYTDFLKTEYCIDCKNPDIAYANQNYLDNKYKLEC